MGWPTSWLRVSDAGFRWKRRFQPEPEVDADDIADVALVPSPQKGQADIVIKHRNDAFTIVLGARDPPGLARRIVQDVRRVLRLRAGSESLADSQREGRPRLEL